MVSFDDVLPTLARVCDTWDGRAAVARWCVVRDLRGRVRLVIEPVSRRLEATRQDDLERRLEDALRGYFVPPVWSTDAPGERGRLARALREQATESWEDPSYEDVATGERRTAAGVWSLWEKRVSKVEWLERASLPPWPLVRQKPPIVAFYSFKGGVGRTTALAACAWQWAAAGQRVAVVDLDLEAPGLGTLMEAATPRGVIDFIVDHVACGAATLDGVWAPAHACRDQATNIQVFPAGQLTRNFVEKLARLDFAETTDVAPEGNGGPAAQALRAMLKLVAAQEPAPNVILLDARAGLHDLAGLSLAGLAHVDVLFCRANEQGYQGLDLTLDILVRRRSASGLLPVIVRAMAPPPGTPEDMAESEEFATRVQEMFRERVYGGKSAEDTTSDAHVPCSLHLDLSLQRFVSLADRRETLFGQGFAALRERIEELCEPDEGEAGEGDAGEATP